MNGWDDGTRSTSFWPSTLHVERLFWSVGMFPWEGPEGIRLEIPLGSDADVLLGRGADT